MILWIWILKLILTFKFYSSVSHHLLYPYSPIKKWPLVWRMAIIYRWAIIKFVINYQVCKKVGADGFVVSSARNALLCYQKWRHETDGWKYNKHTYILSLQVWARNKWEVWQLWGRVKAISFQAEKINLSTIKWVSFCESFIDRSNCDRVGSILQLQ